MCISFSMACTTCSMIDRNWFLPSINPLLLHHGLSICCSICINCRRLLKYSLFYLMLVFDAAAKAEFINLLMIVVEHNNHKLYYSNTINILVESIYYFILRRRHEQIIAVALYPFATTDTNCCYYLLHLWVNWIIYHDQSNEKGTIDMIFFCGILL